MDNMLMTLIDALDLLESCKEDDANKARVLINDAIETVREVALLNSVPWLRFAAAHQALYGVNPSASQPYLERYRLWMLGYLAGTNDAADNIALTHNDLLNALASIQKNPTHPSSNTAYPQAARKLAK